MHAYFNSFVLLKWILKIFSQHARNILLPEIIQQRCSFCRINCILCGVMKTDTYPRCLQTCETELFGFTYEVYTCYHIYGGPVNTLSLYLEIDSKWAFVGTFKCASESSSVHVPSSGSRWGPCTCSISLTWNLWETQILSPTCGLQTLKTEAGAHHCV